MSFHAGAVLLTFTDISHASIFSLDDSDDFKVSGRVGFYENVSIPSSALRMSSHSFPHCRLLSSKIKMPSLLQ